ncbi:MAG: DNA polymerase III subunit delta [Planctomycetota bacterium]|jgi:DNA polymerase III delta subunit
MARAFEQLADLSPSMRIVVLAGKEPWLISEGTKRLFGALEEAFGKDLVDRFMFDGETAAPADVLDELRSYALTQHHKLVIVDDADKFLAGRSGPDDDERAADDEAERTPRSNPRRALEAYAEHPAAEATLLLRAESWRTGRLDKLVEKVGVKIRCDPLPAPEAVAWCVGECPRRHKCEIDRSAAALLVERLGPGLARLDSELEKLASFVGGGRKIGHADVGDMVGTSREEKAWALQSAIMSADPATACAKLRELREVSQVPQELAMWAISDLLRRLHTASQLLRQGVGAHAFRRDLRLFGADGDRIIDVARRTEPRRFAQLLQSAVLTDMRNKAGWGQPERNLEVLTLRVADTIGCR